MVLIDFILNLGTYCFWGLLGYVAYFLCFGFVMC